MKNSLTSDQRARCDQVQELADACAVAMRSDPDDPINHFLADRVLSEARIYREWQESKRRTGR